MEAYEFHERRQVEMQNRIVWILASLSLVYAFFIFPDKALELALSSSDPLGKAIARLVGLASCVGSVRFLLFASDSLFKGNGRAARFVRSNFASRAAEEKYGCTEDEATELWFKYFDTWGRPTSSNHMLMRVTYERTYQARLVHCLQRFLLWMFAISLATMLINHLAFNAFSSSVGSSRLFLQVVVSSCFLAGFIALIASNRLRAGSGEPTGAWRQLKEICDRSRVEFHREVLDRADDLRAAFERVDEIRTSTGTPTTKTHATVEPVDARVVPPRARTPRRERDIPESA